jgi:rod shape determining protein RodA
MSKSSWISLVVSLGILFSLNILMISSLAPSLLIKQLISWIIGVILFIIGTQINLRQIASSKTFIFFCSCLAVAFPILLNHFTRGSRRWIDIAGVSLQPSELIKPWLLLFLVNTDFPFLLLIPVAIILIQPDLGSAITVSLLLAPFILYSRKVLKTSLIIGLILVIISPLIWNFALHDYQKNRVLNFINPQSDPLGKGYNVIQSQIAIGSGGIWGKGYRKGSQGQLLFLPEKHTDFMFAATSEELGLTGSLLIVAAYFILIKMLFVKAFSIKQNRQLFLFTLGVAIQIWAQSFINIGMNVGLLPVTGIPLPFLSVGGSSLMALMFSLGIVFSS